MPCAKCWRYTSFKMKFAFNRSRLKALLRSFKSLHVGVVGDFALDGYWYADMTRAQLSREAPLFVRPVVRESYSLGGASNVAWNLAALGVGEVWTFMVLGHDWRGQLIRQLMAGLGVHQEVVSGNVGWKTPFFGKVVLGALGNQQEDARLDIINLEPINNIVEEALITDIRSHLVHLDALIIADYLEGGVITPGLIQALNDMAREHPEIVFLCDSRQRVGQFEAMVIKPNEVEAAGLFFPDQEPDQVGLEEYSQAGMGLNARIGKPVYITLGEQGCLLCTPPEAQKIPAVPVPAPLDTVGAGDTFLASLAAGLAGRASPLESGSLASLAASIVCRKLGVTGTASPEEILSLFEAAEKF